MTSVQVVTREEQQVAPITPMEMLDRAVSSGASIETLEKLMGLQERWEGNQARKAFDAAMAMAKSEIPSIQKTRTVDFSTSKGRTHYEYEDLSTIMKVVQPILSKYGLSVRYRTTADPNQPISVTCIISHCDGHSETNTLMAGRDESGNKNSIQSIGSTVTYLQRYTLKAALGLAATSDDDGGKADDEGPINKDQLQVLLTLIDKSGTDTEKFCQYMKIDAVADLPAVAYKRAVAKLEAKIERAKSDG